MDSTYTEPVDATGGNRWNDPLSDADTPFSVRTALKRKPKGGGPPDLLPETSVQNDVIATTESAISAIQTVCF